MDRLRVLLTGATGAMGLVSLKQILGDGVDCDIVVTAIGSQKDRETLDPLCRETGISVVWGDLTDYEAVKRSVLGCDLVLHIAALVSPMADDMPHQAMKVNYGATRNIVRAIKELGQEDTTHLVYIGTVAETGDRMPPIHWGRVGDPIKPSIFDYYAVSKVAAERCVIDSGLKHWVSLRQTGIIGPAMAKVEDSIIFHNCLDNVLEYCSDRDSARLMSGICSALVTGNLDEGFWCHVYNIGGGPSCRTDTYSMYRNAFGRLGIDDLDLVFDPRRIATRNFHGQYFLDSDKLERIVPFRHDSMEYFYDNYLRALGATARIARALCKVPGGQRLVARMIRTRFDKLAYGERGTSSFIEGNRADCIEAYWGSRKRWEALPARISQMTHFSDWDTVVHIDHGFDEGKPEDELGIDDMRGAARFRGGQLQSDKMQVGDWTTPLMFECAFGHRFMASPRLVLEGGHWCDVCERTSWNYGARAKVDPFFAQVWDPLHDPDEMREYPKIVSELDV